MSDLLNAAGLVLAALLSGFGTSWMTSRRERRTQQAKLAIDEGALELKERRIDGEAIERAQQINIENVSTMREIVATLRQEVARLHETIASLRSELGDERHNSANLENRIRDLEDTARTMRRLLRAAEVEYPVEFDAI